MSPRRKPEKVPDPDILSLLESPGPPIGTMVKVRALYCFDSYAHLAGLVGEIVGQASNLEARSAVLFESGLVHIRPSELEVDKTSAEAYLGPSH